MRAFRTATIAWLLPFLAEGLTSTTSSQQRRQVRDVTHNGVGLQQPPSYPSEQLSRKAFVSTILLTGAMVLGGDPSLADETATPTSPLASYSIEKCNMSSKSPCVSTSNVRQIDLYSPPWTFPSSYSADEIMSRLKGAIVTDSTCDIVQQDGNQHLVVQAKRPNDLFGTLDQLEFVINAQDQVVTFRSSAPEDSTATDFGLQRRRLDEIRKRAGIFGVMGDSMNTADAATTAERGNGPLGQLKAFYGLQSGGGFEDVLAE
ncbi:DUF1499 domain containing protein [Nitzschia inconspicua]|uniref:DUF1499 domain containing protein n=1 Tax=Nitzschia inconspicua TaxID=303405 RepID=A0A9K3LFY9_9STRA|nr:DUF1499 domain containing protein [Nitzschia inconspicua]